jgi:maltose alpha-D-glucosyltransferase/alpha-amylase
MIDNDPLWYKDAIIYELHVRSFYDAVGNGVGDFAGLAQKLDYLQDLGVTAIWLLPFYPSPLKDDGYDIADYTDINPQYGTLSDFKEFLDAAHARGLRVITELVINHTSDQHPWFQRARRAPPGSPERDFYVWSDTPEKYQEARIIFKDFEQSNWAWDPVAKAYFWHRFYGHQPDLNYDNPAVWNAILPVVDFWMSMGVDGMRLDAVPYLYEREATSCENLPETHLFLKALRQHIDEKFFNRMLLAEANQWPEDAVAYFGQGDECHVCFHFPVMPRLFMSIHMEDRFPILDIMAQTPAIPDNCQWCMFLRNHDELTLEMVTDEERDYMYRAYAIDPRARINLGIRHRLAPLLGNNRRRIELMNGLLFALPGTPVIYYGDEMGMGDNIFLGDRNAVRTPMHWSGDRNAGFSRANPQRLFLPVIIDPEYHYEAINVEAQQNNPNSLLWWVKRLIALRKRHKAFGRGSLEFLHPSNRKILAFIRSYQQENILVIANLSRFVQYVELDLSRFQGATPLEVFGRNPFPRVGTQPYPFTVGPHAFYWFSLEQPAAGRLPEGAAPEPLPILVLSDGWEQLIRHPNKELLESLLPGYLQQARWVGGGAVRRVKSTIIRDAFRLRYGSSLAFICLVDVEFSDGTLDMYLVPLTLAQGDQAKQLQERARGTIVAQLQGALEGVLYDALEDPWFRESALRAVAAGRSFSVAGGELGTRALGPIDGLDVPEGSLPSAITQEEQTNTSVVYGDRFILKFFRRLKEGIHPEVEVGRFLTERTSFRHAAPVLGTIEFRSRKSEPITLGVLHGYFANEGSAWQYTLDEVSRFYERVLTLPPAEQHPKVPQGSLVALLDHETPPADQELIGRYLESARLLGQRTAEMHLAFASDHDDPAFAPEPFSRLYQRSVYQSMRNVHRNALEQLRLHLANLSAQEQPEAQRVLESADSILRRFHQILERRLTTFRLRCHGDYNLVEVLFTGKDFYVIDFEGDPTRSLGDRRIKRSPLRDAASMIRSFHYGIESGLLEDGSSRGRSPGLIRPEDVAISEPWARVWYTWVAVSFLKAYLAHPGIRDLLPQAPDDLQALLEAFLFEKALRELDFELTHRARWVRIPLRGVLRLLETP